MKLVLSLVLVAGCSSKPKLDQEAAAAKIADFANQVCACKTKACAQQVNAELEAWTRENAKLLDEGESMKASVELQNRVVDDLNKFSRCLTTAIKAE
jgi:outer membrane murein-binding lipoprotein Lpp